MTHPIRCSRNGNSCVVTDGAKSYDVHARSAHEARRFAELFTWLANVNPEWTLDEVLSAAQAQHRPVSEDVPRNQRRVA